MSRVPGSPPPRARSRSALVRAVVAFGAFWWEFLVGETPELFVGVVVVVGAAAALSIDRGARLVAAVLLPMLVAAVLGVSLARAARQHVRSGRPG